MLNQIRIFAVHQAKVNNQKILSSSCIVFIFKNLNLFLVFYKNIRTSNFDDVDLVYLLPSYYVQVCDSILKQQKSFSR